MRDSTNISPSKLICSEKKSWHGDLFSNGENLQGKTPLGDFKITTPENLLLS